MDQPLNNQPSISPIKKPIGAERLSTSSKNVFGTQSTSTSPPLINNAGSSDFGSTNDLNINKVITPPLGSNNSSNKVIPTIKVNPIRPNSTNAQHQNLQEPIKPPTPSSFNKNNDLLSYQYQNSNPQVNHFPSANHSFVAPPNPIFNKSNNQSNPIGSNIINNKMNSIPQPNSNFINPMGWSTNDYLINKANNITHTPSPTLSASLVSQANNASISSSSSTLQSNSSASSTPSPHSINPQFQMNAYNNNYNYFGNQPVGSNMKQNQFPIN